MLGLSSRATARRTNAPRRNRRTFLSLEALDDRTLPAVTTTFSVISDWGEGFVGDIKMKNEGPDPVTNWKIEFDFNRSISNLWCGSILSQVGNHYVVANAGWNSTIAPGATVNFGFQGSLGNVTSGPTNYQVSGDSGGGGNPLPTIAIGDATITEGDSGSTTGSIVVSLSNPATQQVRVDYTTATGSATSADFFPGSGTVIFEPGEQTKTISLGVSGDLIDESDENFYVRLTNVSGATIADAEGRVTITDNDPAPSVSMGDASVTEPISGSNTGNGYFQTSGNQIKDAAGNSVCISGVNWFGMESGNYAPHGLWTRGYKSMMDQMKQLGFNTIRLPFSNQLFDSRSVPNSIDYSKNADLQGLNGLGIMDKIVNYAGQIGMKIILDHHRSSAGAGAEGSGLWYTSQYQESRWISDWEMLAQRYAGNTAVIGADLHNEPHGSANWGQGGTNDWRLAAERAGNAVLAANSSWLIVVEGVETGPSGNYWWGGNLSSAGQHPVRLNVANRLVYSPHDYPASIYPQPWFNASNYPNNLPAVWDASWGYLFRQNIAPILLGEFGSKLETNSDRQWLDKMVEYLKGDLDGNGTNDLAAGQQGASWTWWSWNPNSGDTGGILQDDWNSVHQNKVGKLAPVQFIWGSGGSGTVTLTFTVTLSAASGKAVSVDYSTFNGTATSGSDYVAVSGTVTFNPGETTKTISLTVLGDSLVEGTENLFLRLSNPIDAILGDSEGLGTILDRAP